MARVARTAEEIVDWLLANAIPNGKCLECHLRPSVDRKNRERQYVQVGGRLGKKWGVPRLVLHIKDGPLDDDIWALHKCDNTKCINLDHLFKGTAQDNTDDMISKGRKVDDPEVGKRRREWTWSRIKPLLDKGMNIYEIAFELKLSANTVRNYTAGIYVPVPARNEHTVCD